MIIPVKYKNQIINILIDDEDYFKIGEFARLNEVKK